MLLLDEPTSALDQDRVDRLAELLRGLVRGGLALVTVTHDGPFARAVADRIYRLHGRPVWAGNEWSRARAASGRTGAGRSSFAWWAASSGWRSPAGPCGRWR